MDGANYAMILNTSAMHCCHLASGFYTGHMFSLLSIFLVGTCSVFGLENMPASRQSQDASADTFYGVCDSPMTRYIGSLTHNFYSNDGERCVPIALSIVLAFYDIYLNDNIINDGFERPEYISIVYDAYGNAIDFMPGTYGSPGAGGFLYDPTLTRVEEGYNQTVLDCVNECLLTGTSGQAIDCGLGLFQYLNGWGLYDWFHPVPVTSSSEFLGYLDNGVPVIANYLLNRSNKHCVVAFDHDGNGNVMCHNGYGPSNPYNFDTFIIKDISQLAGESYVIQPIVPIPHLCSNNYIDDFDNPICPCSLSGLETGFFNNHSHTSYVRIDNHSHYSTCPDTNVTTRKAHFYSVDPDSVSWAGHTLVCPCGDEVFESHDFDYLEYVDEGGHHVVFDDGCTMLEDHELVLTPYGRDVHKIECECGLLSGGSHYRWREFYYGSYLVPFWMCECGFSNCPFASQAEADAMYEYFLDGGE
ncbi:MAG: hypothetical protein IJS52_02070 [Bacilli bacterium]|nr:hypothetical protein [Bacilli bacterium]